MPIMKRIMLSVVVPFFNEEKIARRTYDRLEEVMETSGYGYEFIFVNDGSTDRTEEVLTLLCAEDPKVKLINFSRNFGHEIATTAGVEHAIGKGIIIIDADLQDPPEQILSLIQKWEEGYDVVYARREKRKGESWFRRAAAKVFYRLLNYVSETPIPVDVGDFRLIDRKVANAFISLQETNRFFRGLISWVGFRQTAIYFTRDDRKGGATKYSLGKLSKLAIDAITSFSNRPLRIATYLGFLTSLSGFLYAIFIIYQKLFWGIAVQGWASLMAVTLTTNGMILLILGVFGEYIGRIFTETKKRPLYIIQSKVGFSQQPEQIQKLYRRRVTIK